MYEVRKGSDNSQDMMRMMLMVNMTITSLHCKYFRVWKNTFYSR